MSTPFVFTQTSVIPVENPFANLKGVPDSYLLGCTADSCFNREKFNKIVNEFKNVAPKDDDVVVISSILFVSPEIARIINKNPELAPTRI